MTEKEIIKALECCVTDDYDESCTKCPMLKHKPCDYTLHKNALDLINRQQAEIERLKAGVNVDLENYASEYDSKIKAEAIKEFEERLKEFMNTKFKYLDAYEFEYVTENDIDNLVKEMVGEQE